MDLRRIRRSLIVLSHTLLTMLLGWISDELEETESFIFLSVDSCGWISDEVNNMFDFSHVPPCGVFLGC